MYRRNLFINMVPKDWSEWIGHGAMTPIIGHYIGSVFEVSAKKSNEMIQKLLKIELTCTQGGNQSKVMPK